MYEGREIIPIQFLKAVLPDPGSLGGSAGRGRHSPHPLEEYNYMLASSRRVVMPEKLRMETADNFGAGLAYEVQLGERKLSFNAEYYYTDFKNQLIANMDRDPHAVYLECSSNPSFSHAFQVESNVDILDDLNLLVAYRYTDVKVDYGEGLVRKPLTSKYKGLISVAYSPFMGLWQFDVTCSLNGGGTMPRSYVTESGRDAWPSTFKAYPSLNAQITRNFRNCQCTLVVKT